MTSIREEIQQLQLRILELEEKEKEIESYKKTSITHNFNVITDVLTEKKTAIDKIKPRSLVDAKKYTLGVITHLEAIHNILQILDSRLSKLEEK